MATKNYKKYMKKSAPKQEHSLLKLFIISFFGMLLVFTFLIKSFSPSVDVSIGDYKQTPSVEDEEDIKKVVDNRLALIQDEDQGRDFSELMKRSEEDTTDNSKADEKVVPSAESKEGNTVAEALKTPVMEPVYKVLIGSYTSAEQAKVAKDIISESGSNLNPIVKCLGSNNYTLQVGIFKNKASADALLYTIQQNHLPGRISIE